MSSSAAHENHAETRDAQRERDERAPLPTWKKVCLGLAGAFVAVGLVLWAFGGGGSPSDLSTSQDPGTMPPGAAGFDASRPAGTEGAEAESTSSELAPVFLRLGFSFFVGFAVGYAFRTFLKLTMIFVGVLLIAIFLLSYVQWVTVNWETMASTFEIFVDSVKDDLQQFHTFITGSLPQAGLASLGLVAGFKRN